jgi:hypothetical protein
MCLEIIASIDPDAKGRVSASRLSELTGLSVTARRTGGAPSLHFSVGGGCSCDFLSDDAEFESDVWALEPAHATRLAEAIRTLRKQCEGFSFLAHWLGGERDRTSLDIGGSELVRLVEENRIGNNVLYRVGQHASAARAGRRRRG